MKKFILFIFDIILVILSIEGIVIAVLGSFVINAVIISKLIEWSYG